MYNLHFKQVNLNKGNESKIGSDRLRILNIALLLVIMKLYFKFQVITLYSLRVTLRTLIPNKGEQLYYESDGIMFLRPVLISASIFSFKSISCMFWTGIHCGIKIRSIIPRFLVIKFQDYPFYTYWVMVRLEISNILGHSTFHHHLYIY